VKVEHKIRIESGGITITQHVDAASYGGVSSPATAGELKLLGTNFKTTQAAESQTATPKFGSSADTGPFGDTPSAGQGQTVIFGPVVIDATGLIEKCLKEQASKQKHEDS
jgi:hypothetical protein